MAEGGTSGQKIQRLKKGDSARTAQHADVMNEIIDKLNTLLSIKIVPTSAGEFFYSEGNVVLLLSSSGGCGATAPPTSGTVVCGSVNGVAQWIATTECEGSSIDGGSA
jgi:hypothetical protein